jgi:ribonuclease-3
MRKLPVTGQPSDTEQRVLDDFSRQFRITFERQDLLRLALTHRSYLSVTGQSARESNERLEFLGDSVLGLVTSEFLYREHPSEHEGQLTKTKSLLVSKAILSRRALAMGLGKYVLMSRSESDSGGRQRLSILADAFEAVIGAIYLDLGFDASRQFIMQWLLSDSREIVADKRHTNYKSHLQEFVQSTYRTHPVYRIRSEVGPDHSKQFNVEVLVGRRVLGTGRGRNKKDAEQAAARNALEQSEGRTRSDDDVRRSASPRPSRGHEPERPARSPEPGRAARAPEGAGPHRTPESSRAQHPPEAGGSHRTLEPQHPEREPEGASPARTGKDDEPQGRRRGRRGGRGRRDRAEGAVGPASTPDAPRASVPPRTPAPEPGRVEPVGRGTPSTGLGRPPGEEFGRRHLLEDELEEIGRPEGLLEERRVDPFAMEEGAAREPGEIPAERHDRFVGGRTVERLGRSTWTDLPAPERTPRGSSSDPESYPEPPSEREEPEPDEPPPGPPKNRESRGPQFGRRRSRR